MGERLSKVDQGPVGSKLLIFVVILVMSSVLFSVFTLLINQTTSLLVLSFFLLILVVSLSQVFPYSNWVSFLLCSGFLGIVHYGYFDFSQDFYLKTGSAVLGYLITALLCGLCLRQYNKIRSNQIKSKKLMDNLIVYDQTTKLMRWPFARQSLINEIKRSRRYNTPLSLLFIGFQEKDLLESNEVDGLNQSLAEGLIKNCRTDIDVPFLMDNVGIYLPETTEQDAKEFAWRIINTFLTEYQIQVSIGMATFPIDGVSAEELVEHASLALKFAIENNRDVVCYSSFSGVGIKTIPEPESALSPGQVEEVELEDDLFNELIESTSLQEYEWFVWFEKFENLEELKKINADIGQQEGVRLLHLSDNQLLITINTEMEDAKSFVFSSSTWALSEVDNEKRLVKLVPKDSMMIENGQ